MADITFRPVYDDSEIDRALNDQLRAVERLEGKFDELGDAQSRAFKEGAEAADKFDGELKNATGSMTKAEGQLDKYRKTQKEATKEGKRFGDTLEDQASKINIMGVNLGDVVGKLRNFGQGAAAAGKGTKVLSGAIRLFSKALIAIPLLAVVSALTSIVLWFRRTQEGINAVTGVMGGLGTVLDGTIGKIAEFGGVLIEQIVKNFVTVLESVKGLGTAIKLLFERDFTGAATAAATAITNAAKANIEGVNAIFSAAKDTIRDVVDESGELFELGKRLAVQREELRVQEAEYNKTIKEQLAIVERLRQQADDITLSFQDRQKAITQAIAIQRDLERQGVQLFGAILKNERERLEIGGLTNDEKIQLLEIEQELNDVIETRQGALAADILTLQGLRKDEQDALNELINQLNELSNAGRVSLLPEEEALIAQREAAEAEVKALVDNIRSQAAAAGTELPADFEQRVAVLYKSITEKFKEELAKLRGEQDPVDFLPLPNPDNNATLNRIQELGQELGEISARAIQEGLEESTLFDQLAGFRNRIFESLGLDDEQGQFVLDQFASTFGSILQLADAFTQQQIAQEQAVIEARQERVNQLQSQLAEEESLRQRGLANDAANLEQAISQENQIIEEAQERQLQIQENAARRQLIINAAQQVSETGLAVAKLINSNAGLGPIALVTIPAAIATIFSLIAAAKTQAQQAAQIPTFREGGLLAGPSHDNGGIPLANRQGRIIGEAEGGEWIINRKASRQHHEFLQALNEGKFDHVNFADLARYGRSQRIDAATITHLSNRLNKAHEIQRLAAIETAIKESTMQAADKTIEYWKSRPIDTPMPGGIKRTYYEGRKKVNQIIKNE